MNPVVNPIELPPPPVVGSQVGQEIADYLDATGQRFRPKAIIPDAMYEAAEKDAAESSKITGIEPTGRAQVRFQHQTELYSVSQALREMHAADRIREGIGLLQKEP